MSSSPDGIIDSPQAVAKELLDLPADGGQWDTTNTLGVEPYVHYGWVNDDDDRVELTISNPEESPINGGETGYEGQSGDGSGPVQNFAGTFEVNIWVSEARTDEYPTQLCHAMRHEVRRIMSNNANVPTSNDLSRLADEGARLFTETEEPPYMYRQRVTIGYGYHDK